MEPRCSSLRKSGLFMYNFKPSGFIGPMVLVMVVIASMNEVQSLSMEEIAVLTGGHLSQQTDISLSNRSLTGPIPPELGSLTNLTSLDLSNNKLDGTIPGQLGNLVGLSFLSLFNNTLTGSIPPMFGKLKLLTNLSLAYNKLSGEIPPVLGNLSKLAYLRLSRNEFEGAVPRELGRLRDLEFLRLGSCGLSGPIPVELTMLDKLSDLSLANNSLSGPIPPKLGNLANLTNLALPSNGLSGPIPLELGNLANLANLDLSNNSLSGPIPPKLGNLANLTYLFLSNNSLSGPIPPELGNLANLAFLDLSDNNLSGPIPPELSNLATLFYLGLSNNSLSGPLPGNLSAYADLYFSNNSLSGTIPPHTFGNYFGSVDLSFNNFSGRIQGPPYCFLQALLLEGNPMLTLAPESLLSCSLLNTVGLSAPLPVWLRRLKELRVLQVLLSEKQSHLDLTSLPKECQYVKTTTGQVINIAFWDACSKGTGCVVDLTGSSSRLSRQTRRYAYLNKVSILLEGASPHIVTGYNTSTYLANAYGNYFLNSTTFLDDLDLGPAGRAYTGVGFIRVQSGNLCGNPEAKGVIALAYGIFFFSLFLVTLALLVIGRWRRRIRGSDEVQDVRRHGVKAVAVYLWGVAIAVVPVVDVVTDILVLSEVWGSWPMWVVLASISAPFWVAAFSVACFLVTSAGLRGGLREVRIRWIWRSLSVDPVVETGSNKMHWASLLAAIPLLPLGLVGALLFDFLAVLERVGLHLTIGNRIVSFDAYHGVRISIELLLESVPQAVFQTALYVLGSSRATRIYIDEYIFVQSIAIALLSLFVQYCYLLWEAVYTGRSMWAVLVARFKSSGRPALVDLEKRETEIERIIKQEHL